MYLITLNKLITVKDKLSLYLINLKKCIVCFQTQNEIISPNLRLNYFSFCMLALPGLVAATKCEEVVFVLLVVSCK